MNLILTNESEEVKGTKRLPVILRGLNITELKKLKRLVTNEDWKLIPKMCEYVEGVEKQKLVDELIRTDKAVNFDTILSEQSAKSIVMGITQALTYFKGLDKLLEKYLADVK